jgi:hypothetical protein
MNIKEAGHEGILRCFQLVSWAGLVIVTSPVEDSFIVHHSLSEQFTALDAHNSYFIHDMILE